ncbi:hypothetical protein RHGRI_036663 [Rhododendron griersonianum]|uniref:Uncharacterized protein n=1 Tax=Rhododendron griersonianum TaxID=479676 RepID=A0AAV6HPB4_9ERIC|nr:hypothetical protein RHGRI_036663 [Rhododendron griersonianum]
MRPHGLIPTLAEDSFGIPNMGQEMLAPSSCGWIHPYVLVPDRSYLALSEKTTQLEAKVGLLKQRERMLVGILLLSWVLILWFNGELQKAVK